MEAAIAREAVRLRVLCFDDMKKFKVLVRGENFLINLDDVKQKMGFYTTRFVEAESEEAAENVAMDMLRHDPKLVKGVLNERSDPPMMYAEEIEELKSFEGFPVPGGGFAFYPEDSEAD
jgi:hypothetical protein